MSIGHWMLVGAFLGLVFGAMIGAGDVLLHYHYPYDPHYDMYPLPIAMGNVAGGDAISVIIPGAIIGYFVGVRRRSLKANRSHEVSLASVSNPKIWPPPPALPGIKEIGCHMNYDPIEDDADIQPILALASVDAHAELAAQGQSGGLGYCHGFWPVKKRILREKYQVEWRSPAEMNPGVMFD